MTEETKIPIDVVHLLPILDDKLMHLLRSLTSEEWQQQTMAKLWKVKDVVAHLLDGNIRSLSILRDHYSGEQVSINSYEELVFFLNNLNADWVKAMKRVSPAMLIALHQVTGKMYCAYNASLDPFAEAGFAVAWSGEKKSKNWMHIAREYTEKWLHQQQIREAVNKPALMTRELFYPFIDTFMLALPYTYRDTKAAEGTVVGVTISSSIGGNWYIKMNKGQWNLTKEKEQAPHAEIIIDPCVAWKLFSKSIRPEEVKNKVVIKGNQQLGEIALHMVSVMA